MTDETKLQDSTMEPTICGLSITQRELLQQRLRELAGNDAATRRLAAH